MRLKIDNFAKVKHADIVIDGITVIAGENNTGKSTIGKVLYSIFYSLHDLDAKIENKRKEEIDLICSRYIRNMIVHGFIDESLSLENTSAVRRLSNDISKELVKEILEIDVDIIDYVFYRELFEKICSRYGFKLYEEQINDFVESTYEQVIIRKKNDNYKLVLEIIQRSFLQIFSSQIQCLKDLESTSKVTLTIKDKDIEIVFKENKCIDWSAEYNILHEAFFLDDPFVLDDLSERYYDLLSTNSIRKQLLKRLQYSEFDIMKGLFDAVSAKDNLKEIYAILDKVADGEISSKNSEWRLSSKQFKEPLKFVNLSAGLKSFVLIKMLLEKGILKEKDVLILDEPEVHLHPEWQLFYAEIIVLLQKKFDLSIVVTTHSSDFLEALDYYSKKHVLSQKCNYYIANMDCGLATFENVTESIEKIYKQMVTPSMLLDRLRYEMENENDEF